MAAFAIAAALCASTCGIAAEQSQNDLSGCMPTAKGDGARWLASCIRGAQAGDGRAALTVGQIYWNGDGVTKDNSEAARWWRMADQMGRSEAAKFLADEAYVRAVASANGQPTDIDRAILEEAIRWYQKALTAETNPTARQQVTDRLGQLTKFKGLLPPR
jgi:TPR repeat protein